MRDGMSCTECGMTNDAHIAEHGCSLHVHRNTPGSLYSEETGVCVTLCIPCHGPKPKSAPGTNPSGRSPHKQARIHIALADVGEARAAQLAQDFTQYVNDAVRMRLEAEGMWPPPLRTRPG